MKPQLPHGLSRIKLLAVAVLAVCAVGLAALNRYVATPAGTSRTFPTLVQEKMMHELVDTLLVRHHIDKSAMRSWHVLVGGRRSFREEDRILVGPEFAGLWFNHQLNCGLASLGAHVVATERTKEHEVTMHIVSGGVTVRSMSFLVDSQR